MKTTHANGRGLSTSRPLSGARAGQRWHAAFAGMATSALLAAAHTGCAVDDNAPSFAAAMTKPKLENAVLVLEAKENSADARGSKDDGILRTRSRSLKLDYGIAHEAASEKAWSKDVAKWGVVRTLTDEHTGATESARTQGLQGTLVVPLGAEERLVRVEVSPRDGSDVDAPLGGSLALRVLHDETPPRVAMAFNVFRDATRGEARLVGSLTYEDLDPAAPECRDLRATASDGKEGAPLALGRWEKVKSGKAGVRAWKATFTDARAWEDPDIVSLRVVCSDATGNLTESVTSGRSDETRFELRTKLELPKGAFEGVPRLGARDRKRWLLDAREAIDVQVKGFLLNGVALEGDVGRASLAGHAIEVVLKVDGEDDRVLLAGPAAPSHRVEFPPTFSGDGRVEMRLFKTTEQEAPLHVESVDVYVPPKIQTSFSLFAPSERIVVKKGDTVTLRAGAVLDGLPFESGDFPVLEWTLDGSTWQAVTGASLSLSGAQGSQGSQGSRMDGEEAWTVSFPYPFEGERPARLRLSARNSAQKVLLSDEVKDPFASKARKPQVAAGDRASCGKARLRPVALSRYACLLVDAPTAAARVYRVTVAFQNTGASPFALPAGSAGVGYEVRRQQGANLLESKHGIVVTSSTALNGQGLDDPAVYAVDLPGWVLQPAAGESIRVDFDKETEGGHSLALGNSCDAPQFFPLLELSGPQKDLMVSPFPCE